MSSDDPLRVVFVCDAGQATGAGHVMRSLALAEELLSRNHSVELLSDLEEIPWARSEVLRRGVVAHPRANDAELLNQVAGLAPSAVVFDSYTLPHTVLADARTLWTTLCMVDGAAGTPCADVVVDQNLGAETYGHRAGAGILLAGARYALIRDDFLKHRRPFASRPERDPATPELLVVMGGTDARGATPAVVQAIVDTRRPCRISVISGSAVSQPSPSSLATGQSLKVVSPGGDLSGLVAQSDIVISAAGSSTWEIMATGTCLCLVQVADNQSLGYTQAVSQGVARGLGGARDLMTVSGRKSACNTLTALLDSATERQTLASAAWRCVDGLGRVRVADVLLGFD